MRLFTNVREHAFSSAGFAVSFAVRGVPSPSCLGVDEQKAKKLAKDTLLQFATLQETEAALHERPEYGSGEAVLGL